MNDHRETEEQGGGLYGALAGAWNYAASSISRCVLRVDAHTDKRDAHSRGAVRFWSISVIFCSVCCLISAHKLYQEPLPSCIYKTEHGVLMGIKSGHVM